MQLSFDFPEPIIIQENYWSKYFGWIPEVGKLASIHIPISYCETLNKNGYCYMMRVKIIELNSEHAKVETTEEWQKATGCDSGENKAGNIWKVETKYLAPVLR